MALLWRLGHEQLCISYSLPGLAIDILSAHMQDLAGKFNPMQFIVSNPQVGLAPHVAALCL